MKNKLLIFIALFSIMLTGCFEKQPMDVLEETYEVSKEINSIEILATITAKVEDGDMNMDLNLPVKFALNASNKKNVSLKLSVEDNSIVDEFSVYANIKSDELNIYFPSTLTDLINGIESSEVTWINFRQKLVEIDDEMFDEIFDEILEEQEELDIKKIVTDENFKLVSQEGDIGHYELILNDELIARLATETGQEVQEINTELKMDMYIDTKTSKVQKISVDMKNLLSDLDETLGSFAELKLTLEFKNYNSTIVTIPSDIIENAELFEMDSVIEDAEKSAFESRTYGMLDVMKLDAMKGTLDGNGLAKDYIFPDSKLNSYSEQLTGSGKVNEDGKTAIAVYNEKWCATKGYNDDEITITKYVSGKCTLPVENNNTGSSDNKE